VATDGMSDVANLMRQRREDLTNGTEEMRRASIDTEELLANRSRDVRETIEGILERWRELGDMLSERSVTLREAGESVVARAETTMRAFGKHTGEFASSTDRLEGKVESLRDQLRE